MTRPALLLFLSLSLTACSVAAPKSSVERQRDATQAAETQAPQKTQEPTAQATPEPSAQPTVDPLIAQMAADNKLLMERVQAAEKRVNDQAERIAQDYAKAAEDNAKTAKYNDAQRQKDVDIAREVTAQKQADADNNAALAELAKAQAELKDAESQLILSLCLVVFALIGYLLMKSAMSRPHIQKVDGKGKEYFSKPWVPTGPASYATKALPVSDEIMYQFVEYAVKGLPLGENSMVKAGAWKSGEAPRKQRQLIMMYLQNDCKHIENSKLNPIGIDYWTDWIDEHRPAPGVDIAENAEESAHEHVNNDHVDSGEVVNDNFGTLKDGE